MINKTAKQMKLAPLMLSNRIITS